MGEVVRICDFHLKRLARDASDLKGQLFAFAKQGGPIVENADPYPEGIAIYESSAGWIEPDAG